MKKSTLIAILLSCFMMTDANAYMTSGSGTGSGSYSTTTSSTTYYGSGSLTYSGSGSYTGSGSYGGTGSYGCYTYNCGTVPEPETLYLMGIGMLGLYLARRRIKK